jgi:hypothetical protein
MKYYKELLLSRLNHSQWELEFIDSGEEWWLEELWTVKSLSRGYGMTVYISFLVDPIYDGPKKSQAIWSVVVSQSKFESRPIAEAEVIAEMSISRGNLMESVVSFVELLNQYRNRVS